MSATPCVLARQCTDLRLPLYSSEMGLKVLANSTRGWKYVPQTPERVGWLYATWAVAWFFLLSALAHVGNAFLWRKYVDLNALTSQPRPRSLQQEAQMPCFHAGPDCLRFGVRFGV